MAKFKIWGQKKLQGEIEVLGAKNAAIILIAASSLIAGKTILENVPDILDIQRIINILEKMGAKFRRKLHRLEIDSSHLRATSPDPKLVGQIRASVVLVGPLLGRFDRVRLAHPGGCTIGKRPIDLHLRAFHELGVKIKEEGDFYQFSYPENTKPRSRNGVYKVKFAKISVGATENILLFAASCERKTIIENAAIEPEVLDLIEFLKKAGVKISRKARKISIFGNEQLKNVRHRVIPDRIEAGTFAILAAASGSNLKISHCRPDHLEALLNVFQKMAIPFAITKDFLYIKKPQKILATDIQTAEYPGYPTDLQPPLAVLLTQAEGKSKIRENIFEHRLEYLRELQKMGTQIKILNSREAEIVGPTRLSGTSIESLDIRAGATLLIAGLLAEGKTTINHAENIDRGYEKIEERLKKIGADIQRVP